MKNAIILHGKPDREEFYDPAEPSPSNRHWLPWLQKQLRLLDIEAQTPELPAPFEPVYADWKRVFEALPVNDDTILVGHSCGGGFLLRWLTENKVKVGRVALVAPWLDPDGVVKDSFFDFKIDGDMPSRAQSFTVFHSDDDFDSVLKSFVKIKAALKGADIRELTGFGHFCRDDLKTDAFPQLLDALTT